MFDPFSMLLGLSVLQAVGKACEPIAEQYEALDRLEEANAALERRRLDLSSRTAILADNAPHMHAHAERMRSGGFNLSQDEDLADFAEDMRVQLKVGEYVEEVLREHGCTCGRCGQVITSPEHIVGKS